MNASFFQELGLFDCAVLQWIGSDKFKVLHDNDTWFTDLFSNKTQGDICVLNNEPFFLVDFLYDANEFWTLKADGRISSGIWSEQTEGNLLRLEASAIFSKGNAYLVLFNMEGEFNKRQGTLQSARELLLSNDKVLEQHDLIRARVESLTSGAERQESSLLKLRNVADNAEFGIAIFDKDMCSLHQNPALYNLFEMQAPEEPSNLLLDLCRDQFPELQRILLTGSLWNGELYWLKPPALSRWLQLTICPLKNEMGDNLFWLFLITDITREKYLKQSNEKLTYFDSLTNLPNRQYFWQYLERLVGINQDFYVMILDVKHLKRTNEAFGFAAGDIVLKEIVSRIAPLLNTNDIFSRIGGNEFAVIIRDVSQHRCKLIADNMISVVSEPYYVLEQCQCNVGLSIGAAHYPEDGVSAEDLMKYADLASFSAKQNIKSSIQFYSTDLKDDALKRMDLESALREAIEKEQFELYLQPILDLASGRIVQAEVLLRWDRPGVGMVSPAEFIPVAEQTGLIVTIGKWVIKEAISLLMDLHRQHKYIKLSVNLSPAQVSDNGLLNFIKKSIVSSEIDASYLELELTEGVLVNDFDRISEFLVELRALGITIAIDDFGTGYSSLSYLQKLPIDFLKIDQSFIFELIGNDSNQAIVQAIIGMAKSLKLKVIAEGVETEAQRDLLKEYCCQFVQGYLFSKPLEYKAFCALLNT
ncbi:putative bifunctional diguanylate cyclase/phosphodiesterase [Marinomonas colpomeniae]|uniref:EAL domain-containing protein n=1 Tax=Marinomonas colpomeniae TaxID=2774408 RepID=A0ABR8P066_9GAMM|nr:EAL domain-containing protein [Marinomonas colpomeniae]MBD5771265.1 EAL domain-containing protein [Marinomonas colpomeniae]